MQNRVERGSPVSWLPTFFQNRWGKFVPKCTLSNSAMDLLDFTCRYCRRAIVVTCRDLSAGVAS